MSGRKHEEGLEAPGKPVSIAGKIGLGARLRAYFLAGILVTAPLSITLYLAWWFITFIDHTVAALLPPRFNPETYLPFSLPGLGVVIIVVALTLIGSITAGFVGRLFLRTSEGILARIPAVRSIYGATKQIFETVLAKQSSAFREVVLVEYPRRGLWVIGFITGTTQGEVQELTADTLYNVFIPTTPNPTSGFLLFVANSDLVRLDMTVEDGIKMVISAGIITPPDRRPASVRKRGAAPPAAIPAATGEAAAEGSDRPPPEPAQRAG